MSSQPFSTTQLALDSNNIELPGLSYELAEWIAANLSHVVGVATDTPTFESEQTREFASRTVSNVLGRSGIYMIENVYFRGKMPGEFVFWSRF